MGAKQVCNSGCRVRGAAGFRAIGVQFRVQGLGFNRVQGLGFGV